MKGLGDIRVRFFCDDCGRFTGGTTRKLTRKGLVVTCLYCGEKARQIVEER